MDDLLNTFYFLCEEAYFCTAAQMIEETWMKLALLESGPPAHWVVPDIDQAIADVRSLLMVFINDEDGTDFQEWNRLLANDQNAFRDKAVRVCIDWQQRLKTDFETY